MIPPGTLTVPEIVSVLLLVLTTFKPIDPPVQEILYVSAPPSKVYSIGVIGSPTLQIS